jgi:hypothetical protein
MTPKQIINISFLFALLLRTGDISAQNNSEVCYNPNLVKDTTKKSIKSMAIYPINADTIQVSYYSPGVRKRIIWGGLVPYDEVWVTGAHDATFIIMPKPFEVNGKSIPAGKYAFFTIPGEKEWTLIINKKWKQHLASEYDEKEDIVRIKVPPLKVEHTERLQYFIEMTNKVSGKISVAWERIKVDLPFSFYN